MWWFEDHSQYTSPPESMIHPDWPVIPLNENGKPCVKYGGGKWREPWFKPENSPELLLRFQYALHMADTPLMCLDIDRHSLGGDGVGTLSEWRELYKRGLPLTLATRSKSGRGYHLFYRKPAGMEHDVIGLSMQPHEKRERRKPTGLDVRAYGLVAFCTRDTDRTIVTKTNGAEPQGCPDWLAWLIAENVRKPDPTPASPALAATRRRGCPRSCSEPIERGRRNDTLFRWGCGLSRSYDDWADHVVHRGHASGLDDREISRIIASINSYLGRA